ncbi:MAG: hypothetical protein JOZ41_16990 [Chloroflexi bacterium]|nr:hypothetical protein [Chloroflexota bacterium]
MNEERRRRARLRALRRYGLLVRLYPRAHREAFGAQMQQAFVDHYRDVEESQGRVGITFWLGEFGDAAVSIGREHLAAVHGAVGRWGVWPYWLPGFILCVAVGATLAGDWRVLAVCALAAALAFLWAGPGALAPKLLTSAGALGVILAAARFATLTGQWTNFFDPIALLVTMLLAAKTAAGIQARLAGRSARLWRRQELAWGLAIAALLDMAIGLLMITNDESLIPQVLLLALIAVCLCGVVGWRVARERESILAGLCASVSALTVGMTLWLESVPIPIVLLWPTFRSRWIHRNGGQLLGPPNLQIWHAPAFWAAEFHFVPRYVPILLLIGLVLGGFAAAVGADPTLLATGDRSISDPGHE